MLQGSSVLRNRECAAKRGQHASQGSGVQSSPGVRASSLSMRVCCRAKEGAASGVRSAVRDGVTGSGTARVLRSVYICPTISFASGRAATYVVRGASTQVRLYVAFNFSVSIYIVPG